MCSNYAVGATTVAFVFVRWKGRRKMQGWLIIEAVERTTAWKLGTQTRTSTDVLSTALNIDDGLLSVGY